MSALLLAWARVRRYVRVCVRACMRVWACVHACARVCMRKKRMCVIGHSRCSFDGVGQEFRTCYEFGIALTSVAFPWDLTGYPSL